MSIKIQLYSYTACGTCKKAIKWLKENKINFEERDIIQDSPSDEIITSAISQLKARKLILNTSGKSYRSMGAAKAKGMSDQELIEALTNDPKLIKRPLLLMGNGKILVGFNAELWAKSILNL